MISFTTLSKNCQRKLLLSEVQSESLDLLPVCLNTDDRWLMYDGFLFSSGESKKNKTKRKQQTSPLTRGLVGPRLYITICHLDMCDQSQAAEDEMYQCACCLVNWAEVSRRHVSAKQREKNKTEQSPGVGATAFVLCRL